MMYLYAPTSEYLLKYIHLHDVHITQIQQVKYTYHAHILECVMCIYIFVHPVYA